MLMKYPRFFFRFIFPLIALVSILGVSACTQTSPYPEDMWTQNIYPGISNTYNVGSPTYMYANGYFTNLFVGGLPVGDNVTGTGTVGRLVQWSGVSSIANATNTDVQVANAVGAAHTQNTDWTLRIAAGGVNLINNGLLVNDLHTDRWLFSDTNTFLGVGVLDAGTLAHTGGNEGYENTVIGYESGYELSTGYSNTVIGHQAGDSLTTGYENTFIGADAGQRTTIGSSNVAVGDQALMNIDVDDVANTAVGTGAMAVADGGYNTAVGLQTMADSSGSGNTAIGAWAGQSNIGDDNVFLGYRAGENNVASDKLYIDNSNIADPLIYGDFASDYVNINGDLGVTDDAGIGGTTTLGTAINYTQFVDGTVTFYGTARHYNVVWVDAGGIKAPGSHPATAVSHGVLETPAWCFANQMLVANQETVSASIRIPERMDRSVEPTLILGWSSTTTSGNVTWQLEYLWTSPGESTAGAAQETLTVTTAVSATAEGLVMSTFTGIDIPSATDACMHLRITRLSASASDTVADDVELHGMCFRWMSNKLGL